MVILIESSIVTTPVQMLMGGVRAKVLVGLNAEVTKQSQTFQPQHVKKYFKTSTKCTFSYILCITLSDRKGGLVHGL